MLNFLFSSQVQFMGCFTSLFQGSFRAKITLPAFNYKQDIFDEQTWAEPISQQASTAQDFHPEFSRDSRNHAHTNVHGEGVQNLGWLEHSGKDLHIYFSLTNEKLSTPGRLEWGNVSIQLLDRLCHCLRISLTSIYVPDFLMDGQEMVLARGTAASYSQGTCTEVAGMSTPEFTNHKENLIPLIKAESTKGEGTCGQRKKVIKIEGKRAKEALIDQGKWSDEETIQLIEALLGPDSTVYDTLISYPKSAFHMVVVVILTMQMT
ncbi:hypothetical protein J3A83DRAFT_4189715 [Scleroderma citrinum]